MEEFDVSQYETIFPASERIYTGLKQGILSGKILSDTVLTESNVAQLFSTSRTPAREALRRLVSENILENIPRKGMLVKNIRGKDIDEHYELALLIEPYAAKLAAKNHTAAQLGTIRDILDNTDNMNYSPDIANYHFHCAIADASGNNALKDCIYKNRYMLNLLNSSQSVTSNYAREEFSHQKILDAIICGDEELAFNLMYGHIKAASSSIQQQVSK